MKIQSHGNSLETNSTGESKTFGIGDASVVIEILRNRLYENKIQTLVQEYICNARDAMREAGKGNDFTVTMPTRLAPTFKVRDFGPGITPDRMEKVFILYGASTKRASNNQTGGFGIGAKSAWSYTDSFTVVSIVDGTRRSYVCHTGTNNQGSMDLISTDFTDEENGTEIQVAVKHNDLEEFRAAIYRAIYFWESRPTVIHVDSELPALTPGYKLSDNIETIDKNMLPKFVGLDYHACALAAIDGIPYPISEKLLQKATKLGKFIESDLRKSLILHFPNGIVEVSASRESIADRQFSIDSLNRMGTQGLEVLNAHLKSEFAKVKTTGEWIETYTRLCPYFNLESKAKFGEYNINESNIVSKNFNSVKMTLVHNLDKRGRYTTDRITKEELIRDNERKIPIGLVNNIYVVTQKENKILQNKRFREFFSKSGRNPQTSKVILLEMQGDDAETLAKVVVDLNAKIFELIDFPIVERKAKVKFERANEEFCMHTFTGTRHEYTSIATNTQKYFYVEIKDGVFKGYKANDLKELSYYFKKTQQIEVVGLSPRALKMVKDNENFTPLSEWIESYSPSKAEVNFVTRIEARNTNTIESILELKCLEDEFLNDMIKEYKNILAVNINGSRIPEVLINIVKEIKGIKEFLDNDAKLSKLLKEKYPLVCELGKYTEDKNELAFYINAKYNN